MVYLTRTTDRRGLSPDSVYGLSFSLLSPVSPVSCLVSPVSVALQSQLQNSESRIRLRLRLSRSENDPLSGLLAKKAE